MFHRVKSEVQETEQRVQRQKVDLDYRQDDERLQAARENLREQQSQESAREEQISRPAYAQVELKEQDELRGVSIGRPLEDKDVQGKYAREIPEMTGSRSRSSDISAPLPAAPSYQRPQAASAPVAPPAAPRASAYAPSTYTPSTYSLPTSVEAVTAGDRTLTIGRGINLSGEIEACDHLVVEGTVEAALKGAKILEIAESGTFYGTVEIDEATIAGRFEGDLTVNGRLVIRASGVITGSIAYRELEVEAGAMLDGRMTPLKGTIDPKSAEKYRSGSEASAMAKAKDMLSKKEPANSESALFSKAHSPY